MKELQHVYPLEDLEIFMVCARSGKPTYRPLFHNNNYKFFLVEEHLLLLFKIDRKFGREGGRHAANDVTWCV